MKKVWKWLIFDEVMGKSLVSCFFDSQCSTVKPFNLAAVNGSEFTRKFIFVRFILANANYTVPTLE